jgi:hypothetical protein
MFRSRIALAAATLLTVLPAAAFAREMSPPRHLGSSEHASPPAMDCEGMTMAQSASGSVLSEYRISSVTPYLADGTAPKSTSKEQLGAVVRVEAQPGLTAQWLQLRLDRELAAIHQDRGAAVGSPLSVPDARTTVSPGLDGFVVTIAAPNQASGRQILERAMALGAQQAR